MSASYDTVVIGAGHNGLTAAGLLARRGRKVLVLERRDLVGGMAASEEFYPGYRSAGLLHDTTRVRPQVVKELRLERHGLQLRPARPDVLALGDGSGVLMLWGDVAKAAREIGSHSAKDFDGYVRYHAFLDRIREILKAFLDEPPVDLVDVESAGAWGLMRRALRVRRLGRRDMMELLRLPPMCVADWLDEWFETDLLKAALALPAIAGTYLGPRSPGGTANLLLLEAAAGPGVAGGGPALVASLEKAARSLGVEIRTGAAVERILTSSSSVAGVALEGGERISARAVAASCDPKQVFLKMLPAGSIPYRLEHQIINLRTRGTTAQALLALNTSVSFSRGPGGAVEFARTGGSLVELERAFDAVKYRAFSETPALEIHVPTVSSPELAPQHHSVVSVLIHFAPHDLHPRWDDAQRRRLGDRVVEILEKHAPGISSSIVAGKMLSPIELENRYGVSGGHIHHGEHALDQILLRPAPGCTGYRTPVPGLFLCGSGSHPGGGLTCAPGWLAASAMAG